MRRFSVIIPAYNAASTVALTIESALNQSVPPLEVLVFDDGSTDNTSEIIETYRNRIAVVTQANGGVANARNQLCAIAKGEMIAFLDADDSWHPSYLGEQLKSVEHYPEARAYFTDHITFSDPQHGHGGKLEWRGEKAAQVEEIPPSDFIVRYNQTPLKFQMSCCCVPKQFLIGLPISAFPVAISGADDTFFHNLLPLYGSIVFNPSRLGAYRVTAGSISSNRLKMALNVVTAFRMLDEHYSANHELREIFRGAYASRLRNCGKYLMGAGSTGEARFMFRDSVSKSLSAQSVVKSMSLLLASFLPKYMQPSWPNPSRI